MVDEEYVDELWDEWEWEQELWHVDDVEEEIELAARQILEMATSDKDPEKFLPEVAGKINRIYLLASGDFR